MKSVAALGGGLFATLLVAGTSLVACTPPPPSAVPAPVPAPKPAAAPVAACSVKEPTTCEALCEGGDQKSCSNLGVLLVDDGLGVPSDPPRAARLFRGACDAGEMNACTNLGSMLARGVGGVARDVAAAKRLFARACEAAVHEACADLGMLLVSTKPAEAAALFEKGCVGGSMRACHHSGIMSLEGVGTKRDVDQATARFQRACERGHPEACNNLGLIRTDQSPPDHVVAARLFKRGCELGSGDACISLGGMALKGTSPVTQDHHLASKLFAQACELEVASGCFNVGLMYEKALAMPPQGDSARQRYRAACKLGHAAACAKSSTP